MDQTTLALVLNQGTLSCPSDYRLSVFGRLFQNLLYYMPTKIPARAHTHTIKTWVLSVRTAGSSAKLPSIDKNK
eukprot:282509-Amphidinium_carterae.1